MCVDLFGKVSPVSHGVVCSARYLYACSGLLKIAAVKAYVKIIEVTKK